MNIKQWMPERNSLNARVTYTLFTSALIFFLLFSLATLFVVFGFEDVAFQSQLQLISESWDKQNRLPDSVTFVRDLAQMSITPLTQLPYFEFGGNQRYGEFNVDGRHYHYLKIEQGFLLLDTTEKGLVSRSIDDIFVILAVALLPMLMLTYALAKRISAYAIKPFSEISQLLAAPSTDIAALKTSLDNIKESDIRSLAITVADATEERNRILDREITFNKGMAHELRTPLQIMSHSSELLALNNPGLNEQACFGRLEKSLQRMTRISDAMLWLTSSNQKIHQTNAEHIVGRILDESDAVLKAHSVHVDLQAEKTLLLPLPDTVLELIVSNLLTNVVNHSQHQQKKHWRIYINSDSIVFSNTVAVDQKAKTSTEGFGLGLDLVKKLTDKFGLIMSIQSDKQWFNVILMQSEGAIREETAPDQTL